MSKSTYEQNSFEDDAQVVEDVVEDFEDKWGVEETRKLILHLLDMWWDRKLRKLEQAVNKVIGNV